MQQQDLRRAAAAMPEAGAGAPAAQATIRASDLPLAGLAGPAALALILRTEGASYRPVGATMVLGRDGAVAGTLSSGCIDADIAEHAKAVARAGGLRRLRYGAGSPFIDLTLPCGGGLDILVLPAPGAEVLADLRARLASREPFSLAVSDAGLSIAPDADVGAELVLRVLPDPRFAVFGKGPEAVAFARMVAGAGYETVLASPDSETLAPLAGRGATVVHLPQPSAVAQVALDAFTAGVLFFHDHDWEPAIVRHLLASRAFYVGAQGSRRTAENRLARLRAAGVAEADLARLRGPIGVIPSTRDARTLAASVLAEVLAEAVVAG